MYEQPAFVKSHDEAGRNRRRVSFTDTQENAVAIIEQGQEASEGLLLDHSGFGVHLDKQRVLWLVWVLVYWLTNDTLP